MRKIKITNEIVDRVLLLSEIKQMPTDEIVEDTGLSTSSVCTIVRIRKAALSQDYDTLIYLAGTSAASGLMVNCQKSLFHKIELPPAVISGMNVARNSYLLHERNRRSHSERAADCLDQEALSEQKEPPTVSQTPSVESLLQKTNVLLTLMIEQMSQANRISSVQLKYFEAAARNLKT